ncbi:MAG: hypothetical protein IJB71_03235 [Bacilli bacterium]|nr:hypothetical protein [Bacilli bacterium]
MKKFELEQPIAYKMLSSSIINNRLANAYLIEDNGSKQGLELACSFSEAILNTKLELTANVLLINPDGVWIKREQIDEIKDKFATKAIIGKSKVYIINGAEKLNQAASSALLKFLEEPEPNITAILVTENVNQVLETIRSRCVPVPLIHKRKSEDVLLNKLKNELFISNECNLTEEQLSEIINFIEYVDKYKIKTILHLKKLLKTFKFEKEEMTLLFNVMLLFYKDVLEYKTLSKVSIFADYIAKVQNICNNNSNEQLIAKIKLIIELLDDLKYNVNIQMELDKFLLKMEEI